MENEIKDDLDISNQEGENLENQDGAVLDEIVDKSTEEEETITIPKKQYQTIIAQKEHWRKKANEPKEEKKEVTPKTDSLSQTDLIAILKADIAEEDISEVTDYAKLKNISVIEALKSSVVKTILSEKNEERKTANATSTGNVRRGSSKQTPSQLLENAKKGEMPDDDAGLEALIKARKGQ